MGNRVRQLVLSCGVLALVWGGGVAAVEAQVPHLIRYQGQAVDSNGVPLEGPYNLTFRLYDAATAGTVIWQEAQSAVPLSNGHFSVLLGQVTPLTSMDWGQPCWLSVQVNSDPELAPRQQVTSVPLAIRADLADRVQDQPPGFKVDTGGTLTDGLIAYWKLEEAGGTRDDQKGANDLADNNTVTQAAGKVGTAAQFASASGKYLSIPDNADLRVGNIDCTIALWFYAEALGTQMLFEKGDSGSRIEYAALIGGSPATPYFQVGDAAGSSNQVRSSVTFAPATWYFAVMWQDVAANALYIQINNGTIDSSMRALMPAIGTDSFFVGQNGRGGRYFDGRIDELGFWKRVLTAQERADLYNAGAGNTYVLGKAATPWTQADAGIAYTEGRLGIGTLTIPNILSIQQGSDTDPIADSWTVYPSDRQHKHILRTLNPHGYLDQLRAVELYEWTRRPTVSDEEATQALRKRRPAVDELSAKKRDLAQAKARLPKFTAKRLGVAIDDVNVPSEILTFNPDGTKAGIDLLAYIGYLHAALKEAVLKIDALESRLPPGKQP